MRSGVKRAATNADAASDAEIGATAAPTRTLVLTAREDLEMARQARPLLETAGR